MSAPSTAYRANVSPRNFPALMPHLPVASSPATWGNLVVQRYQYSPGTIDIPSVGSHVLVVNLAGPLLVAKNQAGHCQERRWAECGNISVTPQGERLWRETLSPANLLFVHFPPDMVAEIAEDAFGVDAKLLCVVPKFVVPDPTTERLARMLMAEIDGGTPGASLMADSLGRAMALHLLRCHSNLSLPAVQRSLPANRSRMRPVVEYMHQHLGEAITLAQLARQAGLGCVSFSRTFREAMGVPPHRYLLDLRMSKARALLEQSDTAVIQIGLECGYSQASHFATMFKKNTGLSPRSWRLLRKI